MPCPFCGGVAKLEDDARLYHGRHYGEAYICENFPRCRGYVGAHNDTHLPKGTLADDATREARIQAHHIFDSYWKSYCCDRRKAYAKLAKAMNLRFDRTHIARFGIEECNRVIEIVKGWIEEETSGTQNT